MTDTAAPKESVASTAGSRIRFGLPSTTLGRWALGFVGAAFVLWLVGSVVGAIAPFVIVGYALLWVVSAALAVVAVLRSRERSPWLLLVLLPAAPALIVLPYAALVLLNIALNLFS